MRAVATPTAPIPDATPRMVQNVTPASSAITTQVRTDVPAPPTVAPWNPQHHSREYPLHRSLHHRLPPTRTTHLIHHIPRTKPPTPVGNVVGKIIKLKSVEKRYIVNIVNRRTTVLSFVNKELRKISAHIVES